MYLLASGPLPEIASRRFRDVVQLCIVALLATGAALTFDRLQLEPGPSYVVALALKIALAVWMFILAGDLARRARRRGLERRLGSPASAASSPTWLIFALGAAVLLLSDILKVIGPAS